MRQRYHWYLIAAAVLALQSPNLSLLGANAQDQAAAAGDSATDAQAPAALSEDELEILVARIALYPDDLVALISDASLYPLEIVEASRFLDDYEKDNTLKPKDSWSGSVISLLNYPEIVRMMSDDLDWTQSLAEALTYQQKDVLVAIQQLREEAVANGIIKTDDKMTVEEQDDNVIITSSTKETVYIPQYNPEMLYVPTYPPAPISYYPKPYPYYYSPTATFFAGAITGAIWASVVDWNRWGVWGGRWNGGNASFNCNNCFNNRNFNGRVNFNDVDWRNVDRSKISIDRNQFTKIDRTNVRNNLESNRANSFRERSSNVRRDRPSPTAGNRAGTRDIRKSTLEGLKNPPGGGANRPGAQRPGAGGGNLAARPGGGGKPAARPGGGGKPAARPAGGGKPAARPAAKPRPGAKADRRPAKPSGLGNVSRGKPQKVASQRGSRSMGGGARSGGGNRAVHRGGGGGRGRR